MDFCASSGKPTTAINVKTPAIVYLAAKGLTIGKNINDRTDPTPAIIPRIKRAGHVSEIQFAMAVIICPILVSSIIRPNASM